MLALDYTILNLAAQPTAPTRESWTMRECERLCQHLNIPYFIDKSSNIWINAINQKDLAKAKLIVAARAYHPGIAIDSFSQYGKHMVGYGRWIGGGPTHLKDASVRIFSDDQFRVSMAGKIIASERPKYPHGPYPVTLKLIGMQSSENTHNILKSFNPWGAFLTFPNIPSGIKEDGGQWVAKSADGLIGAATLITAFQEIKNKKIIGLLYSFNFNMRSPKDLPMQAPVISINFTAITDHIKCDMGPIVCYSDAVIEFDKSVTKLIERALNRTPCVFQKQQNLTGITDGVLFKQYGFKVGNITLAVKNHYNNNAKGKPAPEIISARDAEALVRLLQSLRHVIK